MGNIKVGDMVRVTAKNIIVPQGEAGVVQRVSHDCDAVWIRYDAQWLGPGGEVALGVDEVELVGVSLPVDTYTGHTPTWSKPTAPDRPSAKAVQELTEQAEAQGRYSRREALRELSQMSQEAVQEMTDREVNHPPHYTLGKVECIDGIESALGTEGFRAYCRGNAVKYLWRAGQKGPAKRDIQKAIWYLHKLESTYDE